MISGAWKYRPTHTNPDQQRFRTIGEKVATEKSAGAVKDVDIKCLAKDMTTVRTTSANCWPFWIEGATLVVGTNLDKTNLKQDKFIWLTTEGVSCGNDSTGKLRTGVKLCREKKRASCTTKALSRLGIGKNSSSICIPTITWEAQPVNPVV